MKLNRCSSRIVSDITDDDTSGRTGNGSVIGSLTFPLKGALDLVWGVLGELENLPALQTDSRPVPNGSLIRCRLDMSGWAWQAYSSMSFMCLDR